MKTRPPPSAPATGSGPDANVHAPGADVKPGAPMPSLVVPLYRLAHARTGDKGNRSNISVIAWRPEFFPLLVAQLTGEVVSRHFAHRRPTHVQRDLLPGLHAMNFLLDDVLDGGVNDALNLDAHGKGLAYWLLDLPVTLPPELQPLLAGPATSDAPAPPGPLTRRPRNDIA